MEKTQNRQAANISDWDEAFQLYTNVIASENDVLQVKATIKLARMSTCAPENILACSVPVLVELLERASQNPRSLVLEASAYCLKRVACEGEGRLAILIGQSGVIPILLGLLPDSEGSLQKVLLKCLRNLVMFGDPNIMIVARSGGARIVINMLNSCSDDSRLILLEILSALAFIREVRKLLMSSGSVRFLVESARCGSLISRRRAAQAIGLCALVKRGSGLLVDAGAIPLLMGLINGGDTSMKLVAANALGVILSHCHHIWSIDELGFIPLYAGLLQDSHYVAREIAKDVLCMLAIIIDNAITIIHHLVEIPTRDNYEVWTASADVLRTLLGYKHLIPFLRNNGVLPVLVEILKDDENDSEEGSGTLAS